MSLKLTPEQYDALARAVPELAPVLNAEKQKAENGLKKKLGKTAWGVLAGLATPDAVKAEKYLAATVLTRLGVTLPVYAAIIDALLAALGGPSVKP